MAINLLVSAASGVTGAWTRIEPAKSVDYPVRVSIIGTFGADAVYLEELIGGLPGNGNTPYPPTNTTGTVQTVATVMAPGDITINAPIDFIRARTGGSLTGTASVFLTMGS